jgi:predicted transcriptional regulator of viral defense system
MPVEILVGKDKLFGIAVQKNEFDPKSLYFCKKTGMNFEEFRKTFQPQKAFSTGDIAKEWPDFNFVNLVNWQNKGYLLKLRNTWYAFPDTLETEADLFFLANRMHKPSYISLETALRYYNWIPESVFSVTSVTTAKPAAWQTPAGHFMYRSLQPRLYFGYRPVEGQHPSFNIADPEKTLLDLLYFHHNLSEPADFEGLRLQQEEIAGQLDLDRLHNYLSLINSVAVEKRWRGLQKFLAL